MDMWIKANPNPAGHDVPDCVIRAICIALHLPWEQVHWELSVLSARYYSVTCDDRLWGRYLYYYGFRPFLMPESCPECITIRDFCRMFPRGTYIIGTGSHAVAVIDGNYYDTWDSGDQIPRFFWLIY